MSRGAEAVRSPLAIVGAVICTVSGVLILVLALVGTFGYRGGPYLGILGYLFFPAFFLLGLAFVVIGSISTRRRAVAAPGPISTVRRASPRPCTKTATVYVPCRRLLKRKRPARSRRRPSASSRPRTATSGPWSPAAGWLRPSHSGQTGSPAQD